jgi:hypothetical protein
MNVRIIGGLPNRYFYSQDTHKLIQILKIKIKKNIESIELLNKKDYQQTPSH